MKNSTLFLTLFLSLLPVLSQAKDKEPVYLQDRTVSNHSLSLNILGVTYTYEQAVSRRATVRFSAGAAYNYGRTLGIELDRDVLLLKITTRDYHLVRGIIAVEPRFYYNLSKRHRKEKRTFGNSGGYLSVELGYSFPIVITNGVHAASLYSIVPYWGFRRVWGHFLFDLAGGMGYMASSNHEHAILPALRIGIGYKF